MSALGIKLTNKDEELEMKILTSILAGAAIASIAVAAPETVADVAVQATQTEQATPLVAGDPPRWPPHMSFAAPSNSSGWPPITFVAGDPPKWPPHGTFVAGGTPRFPPHISVDDDKAFGDRPKWPPHTNPVAGDPPRWPPASSFVAGGVPRFPPHVNDVEL